MLENSSEVYVPTFIQTKRESLKQYLAIYLQIKTTSLPKTNATSRILYLICYSLVNNKMGGEEDIYVEHLPSMKPSPGAGGLDSRCLKGGGETSMLGQLAIFPQNKL